MKITTFLLLLGIPVMLGLACQKNQDKKPIVTHQPNSHQIEKKSAASTALHQPPLQQRVMTKPTLTIPAPYHAIAGLLQQTVFVGTANHPTINGGLINAPGLFIHRDAPSHVLAHHHLVLTKPTKREDSLGLSFLGVAHSMLFPITPSFQDDWATSQRVGQLLRKATQHGQLKWVLQKADEMGLPANVAVVPMIESDYQNQVVSKGAAGAWQLMPATAKAYGLTPQQRFEFPRATLAALQLLKDLHHTFNNWELVYAAYHAGTTRVKRALAKDPQARHLEELDLPIATQIFVNRIKAVNQTLIRMASNGV